MRRVIFILLFAVSAMLADGIDWKEDYFAAMKASKAQNKPVMLVVSNHNCKACTVLKNTTLKDLRVVEKLKKEYISVLLYTDEKDYIPGELRGSATPEIWFLNTSGFNMFAPIQGAMKADQFLGALDVVSEEFNKRSAKDASKEPIINWRENFVVAVEEARRDKKPLMIVVSNHGCKWCVHLENTTFQDKRVADALNKDFVTMIAFTDESDYIPGEIRGSATPQIWFLDSEPKPMFAPIQGAIKADDLLPRLKGVLKEYKSK